MKKTIAVINKLAEEGMIKNYAIGGGIAAMFYIEPELTYDIDIFIVAEPEKQKEVVDLSQIYDFLKREGYAREGEHIVVEGVPVQFICADELESEAIENAREISYEGEKARIIDKEYLAAILLRVGRLKDKGRLAKLFAQTDINKEKLDNIISKYGLADKFGEIRNEN